MSTPSQSATKVLTVLDVLLGHFAHGMTPTDLSKATGLTPPNIKTAATRSSSRPGTAATTGGCDRFAAETA